MPERRSTGWPRRGQRRGYADRRVKTRELRQRFLIVCEGGKTEPRYFESFQRKGCSSKSKEESCEYAPQVRQLRRV
jgi:hypothetical protein